MFFAIIYCRDCSDSNDRYGCNEGRPWFNGPFKTEQEAKESGKASAEEAAPWYFEIYELSDVGYKEDFEAEDIIAAGAKIIQD